MERKGVSYTTAAFMLKLLVKLTNEGKTPINSRQLLDEIYAGRLCYKLDCPLYDFEIRDDGRTGSNGFVRDLSSLSSGKLVVIKGEGDNATITVTDKGKTYASSFDLLPKPQEILAKL